MYELDFALYQLIATGIVSALTSVAKLSFACSLSTAVNAVAATHYWFIRSVADNEVATDMLRYSDWAVTLPFMVLELHILAEEADHTYEPAFFSKEFGAFTLLCVVALGAIWRFDLATSGPRGKCIGVLSFASSCVLLAIAFANLFANLQREVGLVMTFSVPWIGYPVVSTMQRGCVDADARRRFKNVAFSALDVWSKAGLALAVSLHTRD